MAAGTFMVVSTHFVYYQNYGIPMPVEIDSSRIAASVVSGIGFLAGGAILKTGLTIQGLTTAAGLWLVTAIGLCAGGGMYVEAVTVTLMGLLALTVLRRFEDKSDSLVQRQISMDLDESAATAHDLEEELRKIQVAVSRFNYEKRVSERLITMDFLVKFPASLGSEAVIRALEKRPGLKRLKVSQNGGP
jgi:putative Mg2+ transporter-C (MgtC) family protein